MKRYYLVLPVFIILSLAGTNVVWAQSAIQFDGTNDYVTFGAATSTLGATSFTLECWIKRAAGGNTMTTGSLGLDGASG